MKRADISEIRLGALYRIAARKRLGRSVIVSLLAERVGLTAKAAEQLAGHWLTTEPFRATPA